MKLQKQMDKTSIPADMLLFRLDDGQSVFRMFATTAEKPRYIAFLMQGGMRFGFEVTAGTERQVQADVDHAVAEFREWISVHAS